MPHDTSDVVIIGAGAAGLMAAWELVQAGKSVIIVEARDRIGGRIHTLKGEGFSIPIELGAEFIHGNLEHTNRLLKKAGIESYKVEGDIWRKEEKGLDRESDFVEDYNLLNRKFRELERDLPVSDFLENHLQGAKYEDLRTSLKSYVEGYYAADPARTSTFALRDELQKGDEEQYRIEGGYEKLVDFLAKELESKGCRIVLSAPVHTINWEKDPVEVLTTKGSFYGQKLLVTVPLGVLQSGQIAFYPDIPDKMEAATALGFGPVIKVTLQFSHPFWKQKEHTGNKDLSKAGFVFSEEEVPTWWTQQPKDVPILVGWLAGPNAGKARHLSEEDILQKALSSLANIFTIAPAELKRFLGAYRVSNWAADPYCNGGYSYEVVGGQEQRQKLKAPIDGKLFFAGEALYEGVEGGTVEAALVSGRDTAHQVIAGFS